MIQNVLRAIGGIGTYDAISICLFVGVFGGALIWVFKLKAPFVNAMSSMPLEKDEVEKQPLSGGNTHE
jgi:hypothetical protein